MYITGETGHKPVGTTACLFLSLCFTQPAYASVARQISDGSQTSTHPDRLALRESGGEAPHSDGAETSNDAAPEIPAPDVERGDKLETNVTDEDTGTVAIEAVTVLYDLNQLPAPVRRMRELIVTAASEGNIDALRPLLGTGGTRTELSIGGYEGDPIDFLRETSGDGNGHETLAILLDILSAGYVHLDPGEPTEQFLWPYFYAMPLERLDDRQKVELFRIITAGDFEDMKAFGAYIFYRTAIGPEGDWMFFVAGD